MKPLSLLLPFLSPLLAIGQQVKTDIESLDIFSDPREKAIFANIQKSDSGDYFQLFLLTDNYDSNKADHAKCIDKVNSFLSTYQTLPNQSFSDKDLKKLYKQIHDAFLVKYETNPGFSEIFVNGNYNCATASALYALLLKKLSVPFEIRETPDHVYIVAAPLTFNILFETTAPGAMVLQFDEKTKDEYIKYLVDNKIISKEEVQKEDKNKLFEKYFYSDKPIDIRQLAGLHYYNRGIDAAKDERFLDAYKNFEKAFFLYPDQKMKYLTVTSLAAVIDKSYGAEADSNYKYYLRYGQLGNDAITRDLIIEYFEKLSKKLLIETPDTARYNRFYQSLVSGTNDTILLRQLRSGHYFELAYYYYLKNNYRKAMRYTDSVYNMNKENLMYKGMLEDVTGKLVAQITDTKKAIDTIDFYLNKYPFLKENSVVVEYQIYCLCRQTCKYYENLKYDHKNGMKYFQRLQSVLKDHPESYAKEEPYVVETYGTISSYYVRAEDYRTARTILVEAQKYLPDNEELDWRVKHCDKMIAKLKK